MKSIFIFRRDFNLKDNYALNELLKVTKDIDFYFFFTEIQINKNINKYYNDFQFKFMCNSLNFLATQCNLHFNYINNYKEEINVIKNYSIVAFNYDHTAYSNLRDKYLIEFCKKNNIQIIIGYNYYRLLEPRKLYFKFSFFYDTFPKKQINIKINNYKFNNPSNKKNKFSNQIIDYRKEALKIFKNNFKDYNKNRNFLNYETTKLGKYIKFSLVTLREVFNNYLKNKGLLRELIYREHFFNIHYHNPNFFLKNEGFRLKINWTTDKNVIKLFLKGQTGYDLIDAGIQQLLNTNFIHNRIRMILCMFCVKNLLIDWRYLENLFARYLSDYDPIINFYNHAYMSGLFIYSFPVYRIFNIERQIKLYNGEEYIKQYLVNKTENKIKIFNKDEFLKKLKKNI